MVKISMIIKVAVYISFPVGLERFACVVIMHWQNTVYKIIISIKKCSSI